MLSEFDITNIYNLNIINLNKLIIDRIDINIKNFLYDNNLLSLKENSKDIKKIYNHFIISSFLEVLNENYKNIFIFTIIKEEKFIIYNNYISNLSARLNLSILIFEKSEEININTVYKIKAYLENKKSIDIIKVKKFLEKNDLTALKEKFSKNIKIKLLLNK
jgi:hypothetical protein